MKCLKHNSVLLGILPFSKCKNSIESVCQLFAYVQMKTHLLRLFRVDLTAIASQRWLYFQCINYKENS